MTAKHPPASKSKIVASSNRREPLIRLDQNLRRCFVCGPENPVGLRVAFVRDGERGARANYTAQENHCGWPGLLHGGVALALLDEALAWALYFQGLFAVTAKMETRFRQPIRVGDRLLIRAWTLEQRKRLVAARAEIRYAAWPDVPDSGPNTLLAEACATLCIQQPTPPARP